MGLNEIRMVSLTNVARTGDARLDSHHFLLYASVMELAEGLRDAVALRQPHVLAVSNGENLPQASYDTSGESDGDYLYVSVGALSQFVLQTARCVSLKPPDEFFYKREPLELRCRSREILVTRSGTPGIAWPCALADDNEVILVPSGFVIRIDLDSSGLDPIYASAVLNHPVWRVWSSSLAGGKRQRNLSQDNLGELLIPRIPPGAQAHVRVAYSAALEEIEKIVTSTSQLRAGCDAILEETLGIPQVPLVADSFRVDDVTLFDCGQSNNVRLDARFHRGDIRASLSILESTNCKPLRSFITGPVIKRGQPTILTIDDPDIEERVIATVSLQDGQIARDLTKPTDAAEITGAGTKRLRPGDVLIAMDGEGSIGKAAPFEHDLVAVTDAHVGALRTGDPTLAAALACFLNASPGQAQVEVATSGATGQTQLSRDDLERFQVPENVAKRANVLADRYAGLVTEYEARTRKVRRRLCEVATEVNAALLEHSALDKRARRLLTALKTPDDMLAILDRLVPEMF